MIAISDRQSRRKRDDQRRKPWAEDRRISDKISKSRSASVIGASHA